VVDPVESVLEVEGLVVRYGSRTAVDDLRLTVARGEIFGLLGPNGAGKTSTLSAIEGLLSPAAGNVRVAGRDAVAEKRAAPPSSACSCRRRASRPS
jgi:ABC-2 type transport system ATP-binding protein